MLLAALKLSKATTINFAAVTTPVLAIRGECDRLIPPQVAPWIAAGYHLTWATFLRLSWS
jgi:hypothetical protein